MTCSVGSLATELGLIDVVSLRDDTSKWRVLDARPQADWKAGHIPGARSFSWEDYTRTDDKGIRYTSFTPMELATALAGLGISEETPVVVYGDADKSWGGEGYAVWLLSWLGHKGPIMLLSGGIQAWKGRNLPMVEGIERADKPVSRYQVALQPELEISTEELVRQRGDFVLVDVRSSWERVRGKIPGAVHIPWERFYTGKDRRPLPPAELKMLLAEHGVDTSKPVVYYCLGGIRSAYAWLAHHLSGLPEARNYKGGWAAWHKTADSR